MLSFFWVSFWVLFEFLFEMDDKRHEEMSWVYSETLVNMRNRGCKSGLNSRESNVFLFRCTRLDLQFRASNSRVSEEKFKIDHHDQWRRPTKNEQNDISLMESTSRRRDSIILWCVSTCLLTLESHHRLPNRETCLPNLLKQDVRPGFSAAKEVTETQMTEERGFNKLRHDCDDDQWSRSKDRKW